VQQQRQWALLALLAPPVLLALLARLVFLVQTVRMVPTV
jgi:hypothetical protein